MSGRDEESSVGLLGTEGNGPEAGRGEAESRDPNGASDSERRPEGEDKPETGVKPPSREEIENETKDKARQSIARGLIDFGLLASNSNQLKTVLTIGSNQEYYEVKLTLLSLSLLLQITAGALKIVTEQSVGFALKASDRKKRCLNLMLLCVVFAILVLNVFILTFGISPKDGKTPASGETGE